MEKTKPKRKITFITLGQALFITIKNFLVNKMPSYAEACSFGFLFSFIPIIMITLIVMIRILHASPVLVSTLLKSFFATAPQFERMFSSQKFMDMIAALKFSGFFEIFIGFFAFWMSRRFLVSVFQSFKTIFHTQFQRKSVTSQLLMFGMVTVIIFAFTAVVFAFILVQTITSSRIFLMITEKIPQLDFFNHFLTSFFIKYFPNIIIFVLVSVLYKFVPGTKPSFKLSMGVGLFCTVAFFIFGTALHLFMNTKNYNIIYGFLSQMILLLLDIFFFFTFFLFCAQLLYVCQFFDDLLIGELYLLPKQEEKGKANKLRRKLFLRPDFLLAKEIYTVELNAGEVLFEKGDEKDETYYIVEGSVQCVKSDSVKNFGKGEFFGEIACVLKKPYDSTAMATSPSRIVKIKGETFRFLVEQDSEVAKKTLSQISSYFSDYYGKTEFTLGYDF